MRFQFTAEFVSKISTLSDLKKQMFLAAIKDIKALENPRQKGGRYHENLWAYPVTARSVMVCRLDDEDSSLVFLDIILHL